jgi:glycerophosphoryl diester phosphodiesterase
LWISFAFWRLRFTIRDMSKPLPKNGFAKENGVIVMAHRGGGGRWPENTMLAFENAVKLGVDALETDIHSTADGVIVVAHDDFVERVTNGNGRIQSHTLAQLKQLNAGYWWTADNGQTYPFRGQGITIPTLEELFTAFPNMWINIDIKQADPSIVTPLVQMLREFGMMDKVVVGSFYPQTLAQFRRECPKAVTAASENEVRLLVGLSRVYLERLWSTPARTLQVPDYSDGGWHVVTERFVQAAHRRGTAVHVWTVDEIADMQRLIDIGVDGLMTDYPDRLLKLLGRLD